MNSKHLLTILMLFTATILAAQQIPDQEDVGDLINVPCPYDPVHFVDLATGWIAYQTTDNTSFGPVDTTLCISTKADPDYFGISFDIDEMDTSKPVFLKAVFNDTNKIKLDSNFVYHLSLNGINFSDFEDGADTVEYYKSAIILGLEHPDSTDTTYVIDQQYIDLNSSNYMSEICFASSKFEVQYISSFIYKFNLAMDVDDIIYFYPPYVQPVYETNIIEDFIGGGSFGADDHYKIYIEGYFGGPRYYLGVYNKPNYPSAETIDTLLAMPEPNQPESTVIDIEFTGWSTFIQQNYTLIAGGMPLEDTIPHSVNVILNDGMFCEAYDIIYGNRVAFIYRGGMIDLPTPGSCFNFYPGSTFIVDDNAKLEYGLSGSGMLWLHSGSTIELRKNAKLIIGNTVKISDASDKFNNVYITLDQGDSLIFQNGSHIKLDTATENMFICLYMKGGYADISGLPLSEQKYIRFIYPNPKPEPINLLTLYPNPFEEYVVVEFAMEISEQVTIKIYNLKGEQVYSQQESTLAGINSFAIPLQSLHSGNYLIEISNGNRKVVQNLVKL
ncbi:MAG TPA: T9SS type A sorting domain-containing protein [Chitinophagales bacterium]|nr:T9SS type A sorting domain-containing protein [Chitinophagales bacterium]HRG86589.1 T9SS type A sorting domain-containing protein [Chitinophagales bacterium]HRH54858.1 T9SS type A sorting domain-containing protein [Chitinophagales bacterium]